MARAPSASAARRAPSEFPDLCATTKGPAGLPVVPSARPVTYTECTRAEKVRRGKTDQDDDRAERDVEDVVVGCGDDGERHGDRHDHGERSHRDPGRRLEEDDSEEEVPAEVQARERGVLVREGGRLQRPVAARVLRHRVHDLRHDEPRRRDRDGGEEDEADQPGDDHRIPQKAVPIPPVDVEKHAAGRDHRPVPVDVHPVRERGQDVVTDDHRLDPELPGDTEGVLDPEELPRVRERLLDTPLRETPNAEVDEHGETDQRGLARERDRRTKRSWRFTYHADTIARPAPDGVRRRTEARAVNYREPNPDRI
jgi:hypothetical protein